jgi:hypothetical protein
VLGAVGGPDGQPGGVERDQLTEQVGELGPAFTANPDELSHNDPLTDGQPPFEISITGHTRLPDVASTRADIRLMAAAMDRG